MAWTQDDLTALEAAIATGALTVQYTDKKIEYRSLKDMLQIRDMIRGNLGLVNKTTRIYMKHSKGLKGCE